MVENNRTFLMQLQRGQHPSWLLKASEGYVEETGNSYTESSFLRGSQSIQILERLEPILPQNPNVLLVGLGRAMEPIVCTYEPFRIAAHLQGKGYDYRMTLVDIDPDVIDEVRNRETLYIPSRSNQETVSAWQKYIADTQQTSRELREPEQGLELPNYLLDQSSFFYYDIFETGVLASAVPPLFRQKLQNGEVAFLHADIAVADICSNGPYDYVEFTNVLYLMSHQGQQLAMANVALSLRDEGRLLINDIGGYVGEPLLPRFGGWCDEEKMEQLGLELEEVLETEKYSQTLLLKKAHSKS